MTSAIIRQHRLARLVQARRGTMSLRDAAAAAGVSASTLSRVEAGRDPDLDTLSRLCEWMKVSPNEALGWTGTERMSVDDTLTLLLQAGAVVEIVPLHGQGVGVRVQLPDGRRLIFAEGPLSAMLAEAWAWTEAQGAR